MSCPLSNSLFHFIDCDVKNEVLRAIMDGRHVHTAKTQWWAEKSGVGVFACQCHKHRLKMLCFAHGKGFSHGTGLLWLWYEHEHFSFTFDKAKNCGYIKYWEQRDLIYYLFRMGHMLEKKIFKSLHFLRLSIDAKIQHLQEGNSCSFFSFFSSFFQAWGAAGGDAFLCRAQ